MVCMHGAYLLSSVYKMILIFTNGKFYLCNLQMARPDQVRPHSLPFLNYTYICIHSKLHVHHNYDSSPHIYAGKTYTMAGPPENRGMHLL